MTIRKYRVTMQVEKEMIVSIDDTVITPRWMEDFSSYMYSISEHSELCEHIGHNQMFYDYDFVDGVGELSWLKPKESIKEYGVSVSRVETSSEEFEVEELK